VALSAQRVVPGTHALQRPAWALQSSGDPHVSAGTNAVESALQRSSDAPVHWLWFGAHAGTTQRRPTASHSGALAQGSASKPFCPALQLSSTEPSQRTSLERHVAHSLPVLCWQCVALGQLTVRPTLPLGPQVVRNASLQKTSPAARPAHGDGGGGGGVGAAPPDPEPGSPGFPLP